MGVIVPSKERSVYTLRLADAERRLLEAAAAMRQEYLAEFIRRTALQAARLEITARGQKQLLYLAGRQERELQGRSHVEVADD